MDEVYSWAADYIGIPFVSGGRDRTGLDCYGLLRLVMAEQYGYQLPLLDSGYDNALNIYDTSPLFFQQIPILAAEKIAGPQESAVALLEIRQLPCHIGIWCGGGCILHARSGVGVVAEKIDSRRLPGRIAGWYRVSESYRAAEPVQPGAPGVGVQEPERSPDSRKN
ncbi:MAG: C40 family peptidase [Spirochaetaceae bacterium]|nr:C40 family peptidase [Spirochaetaceae bacterium]